MITGMRWKRSWSIVDTGFLLIQFKIHEDVALYESEAFRAYRR